MKVGDEVFRADRLVELRKKNKLTQEQLANKVNLTKAAISNYENDRSAPPNETLAELVAALHTNSDYLLGITDNPEKADSNKYGIKVTPTDINTKKDFHFYDTDGVQFIARSDKNLSPEAYKKLQELAKKVEELFDEEDED